MGDKAVKRNEDKKRTDGIVRSLEKFEPLYKKMEEKYNSSVEFPLLEVE